MGRFHSDTSNHMCHKAASEMLGITPLEFAELRRSKEAPEPDIVIAGDPPRWKRSTIAGYKRQRARLKAAESLRK